jgi:hypothetical protein
MEHTRDPALALTLEKLMQTDSLFVYNVPAKILSECEDARLIEHLREAYRSETVIIENPTDVQRFARKGDSVSKKGDYRCSVWTLEKDTRGRIADIKGEKAVVKFKGIGKFEIPIADLTYYGEKDLFWVLTERHDGNGPLLGRPLTKLDINRHVGTDTFVQYAGKPIYSAEGTFIPDGTRGIIAGKMKKGFAIIWDEDLTGAMTQNHIYVWHDGSGYEQVRINPEFSFDSKSIKLIRKNRINFDQVYQECIQKLKENQ